MHKKNLLKVYAYFHAKTGITFNIQMGIFENKLKIFCKRHNINSFATLCAQINSNKKLDQELINHLTTNETYFFREIKQIEEFAHNIKATNFSSTIDILSVPCSSGEEPYTLSIMLLEAGIKNFHITSVDINSDVIQEAKEAKYKPRYIKNLSKELLEKYFSHEDSLYILKDEIKKHTTFKVANIFDNNFDKLGKFDYIFSRNMLIYFEQKTKLKAKKILEGMRKNNKVHIFLGHADLFI